MFNVNFSPVLNDNSLVPFRTITDFSPSSSPKQSRHPQDIYRYPRPDPQTGRLHRARSTVLEEPDLTELRAAQRTFEGSYIRTSLSQFSFALVVLKIFTAEFYSIGALFAVYGAGVLAVGGYRRREGNRMFFIVDPDEVGGGERRERADAGFDGDDGAREVGAGTAARRQRGQDESDDEEQPRERDKRFRTSGNVVLALTVLSVMAYATLLVLTLRLANAV